jgi:sulfite reductase (NADPH) flavoprotein alpha-component
MLENAAEISGDGSTQKTHLFVCGGARRMTKDADAALRKIVQEKGGQSADDANEYVETEKRQTLQA